MSATSATLLQGSLVAAGLMILTALSISGYFVARTGYRLWRHCTDNRPRRQNAWLLGLDFALSLGVALVFVVTMFSS